MTRRPPIRRAAASRRPRPRPEGAIRASPSSETAADAPSPTLDADAYLLYADGASRGNPGPAAIGGLVLGPDGAVLGEVSEAIGRATNNVAEWRAAVAVLEEARRLGARSIELRMDSELVIRQLTGVYRVHNAALRPFYEQARGLMAGFERFVARHVPRARNARADALANAALDGDTRRP